MTHHARTRAPGTWLTAGAVTAAEYEDIDAKTYRAINGDDGGSWAPSSQIVIGGAGIDLSGPSSIGDCSAFAMGATGSFTIDPGANLDLYADITFDGSAHSYIGVSVNFNATSVGLTNVSDLSISSDSTVSLTGVQTIYSGASVVVENGGKIAVKSSGLIEAESGSTVRTLAGSLLETNGKLRIKSVLEIKLSSATNANTTSTNDTPSYHVTVGDSSTHTFTCHITTGTAPTAGQMMFLHVNCGGVGSALNVGNEGGGAAGIAAFGVGRGGLTLQFDGTLWRVLSGWGGAITYGADA